jgi:hypothetical protein
MPHTNIQMDLGHDTTWHRNSAKKGLPKTTEKKATFRKINITNPKIKITQTLTDVNPPQTTY